MKGYHQPSMSIEILSTECTHTCYGGAVGNASHEWYVNNWTVLEAGLLALLWTFESQKRCPGFFTYKNVQRSEHYKSRLKGY